MLKKITIGLAVTSAQSFDFDIDLSGLENALDDFSLAVSENGDTCISDSYCKSLCCSRNLKLDTTPYLTYNYFNTTFSYT